MILILNKSDAQYYRHGLSLYRREVYSGEWTILHDEEFKPIREMLARSEEAAEQEIERLDTLRENSDKVIET